MRQSPNLVHVIVMNAVAVTRKNVIHVPEVAQVCLSFWQYFYKLLIPSFISYSRFSSWFSIKIPISEQGTLTWQKPIRRKRGKEVTFSITTKWWCLTRPQWKYGWLDSWCNQKTKQKMKWRPHFTLLDVKNVWKFHFYHVIVSNEVSWKLKINPRNPPKTYRPQLEHHFMEINYYCKFNILVRF